MILKNYQLNKIDLNQNKIILFYGKNEGLKSQEINNIVKNKKSNIFNYEEKNIIENKEDFFNELLSNSFFEEEKIILINRAVPYDTEMRKQNQTQQQPQQYDAQYRGVKFVKEVEKK